MQESDDSAEEPVRRRERGLRRAFSTPPQPHGKNPRTPPAPEKAGQAREGPPRVDQHLRDGLRGSARLYDSTRTVFGLVDLR
jgi:hypothetical protein